MKSAEFSLWGIILLPNAGVQHLHMTWNWTLLWGKRLVVLGFLKHSRTEWWDEAEKWGAACEDYGTCRRRMRAGVMADMRGGVGGHTEDGVLTIPWVISQLSMGSSWSAGLSSPFTLSWINNRTTPYTREEREQAPPQHSTQCRERDRGEVKYARDDFH